MPEPDEAFRLELARAFEAGRPPAVAPADAGLWIRAVEALIFKGRFDRAAHAIRALDQAQPELEWARNMAGLFELMPPPDPDLPEFIDDAAGDVQVVARPGARATVLCFCGGVHRLSMALSMMHRWMAALPANIVYLRDFHGLHYLGGVRSLAADAAGSVASLRSLVQDLGGERLLCFGVSTGGYGALRYGLDLQADAVMSIGGPVNLEPRFVVHLRHRRSGAKLRLRFPDEPLDLRLRHAAAPTPPRVTLVYGEHQWDDRLQAEQLAGAPGVRLRPVAGFELHGVVPEIVRRGELSGLLQDFLADGLAGPFSG